MHFAGFRRTLSSAKAKWWIQSSCVCATDLGFQRGCPTAIRLTNPLIDVCDAWGHEASLLLSLTSPFYFHVFINFSHLFRFSSSHYRRLGPLWLLLSQIPQSELQCFSHDRLAAHVFNFWMQRHAPTQKELVRGPVVLLVVGKFWVITGIDCLRNISVVDPVIPEKGEKLGGLRMWGSVLRKISFSHLPL